MRIDQTPTLLNSDYTRAQDLRMEIAKVISVRDLPNTSAASKTAINAFLSAVGGGALPATSAVVTNGMAVPLQSSTGMGLGQNVSAAVASSSLGAMKLPANVGIAISGAKFTVTGSGPVATLTVAGGSVTGVVLSAS